MVIDIIFDKEGLLILNVQTYWI